MRLSNWKSIFVMGFLVCLSACMKPDHNRVGPNDPDSSDANFIVKDVSGEGMQTTVDPLEKWKIPTAADFSFRACLQDRNSRVDVRNEPFVVKVPGSSRIYPARTDAYGCMTWNESLPFNFFAKKSGWVTLVRDIQGSGVYEGTRQIKVAVDPWAVGPGERDNGKSVCFLRTCHPQNLIPERQTEAALLGKGEGQARLIVQNVKIRAIPESESEHGLGMLVEVEMEPVVELETASGQRVYRKIYDGDFVVQMQALQTQVGDDMKGKFRLLSGSREDANAPAVNGILKAEIRVSQNYMVGQGNLELAMRIQPVKLRADSSPRTFEGLFRLGPGTVLGSQSGWLENVCLSQSDNHCSYSKIIKSATNYDELVKAGYIKPFSRYIFSILKLTFNSVAPGETATERTVIYSATTCVTDRQTGSPLRNTPMTIRYVKPENPQTNEQKELAAELESEPDQIPATTDDSGCLHWNGRVTHMYYKPEHFFSRVVSIEKGSTFKYQIKFYLDPWDDKFLFGRDQRELTMSVFNQMRSRKKVPSRFFIGGFGYHTRRFLYNIDPYMNLEVKKTILLDLNPQVLRYSGIANGRKMVERLRDGIYLMKVAIQKSYLDPRDNSGWLLHNSPEHQEKLTYIGNSKKYKATPRHFVTTNMALVRVVDGMIIYPIPLTMRDLRLMRIRSNFLIELQTVDENLIQAYQVFKRYAVNAADLENKLKHFREEEKHHPFKPLDVNDPSRALKPIIQERQKLATGTPEDRKKFVQEVKDTRSLIASLLAKWKIRDGGQVGVKLDGNGKPTSEACVIPKGGFINDNCQVLNKSVTDELKTAMGVNDFSEVSLPKRDEIDLNLFVQDGSISGLKARTFVGPVIFLSNNFSDSMRATDNLDETNCMGGGDTLKRSLEELELQKFEDDQDDKNNQTYLDQRQNNAYQYNEYFGSLTNLCYKSVDDLMQDEKSLANADLEEMKLASLKYNFIKNFNLDFVSLTDEPLKKLDPKCQGSVGDCMQPTREDTYPAAALDKWINDKLPEAVSYADALFPNLINIVRGVDYKVSKTSWQPAEYEKLFYTRSLDGRVSLCNLLANKFIDDMKGAGTPIGATGWTRHLYNSYCNSDGGLIHDIKYQVLKTGDYVFLGGLNLNFNVGESFSISNSDSWSAGLELADMIGLMKFSGVGAFAGAILKAPSLKKGWSYSESNGTNVSESTYLVSQMADFELNLLSYEKCAVIRLSDDAAKRVVELLPNENYRLNYSRMKPDEVDRIKQMVTRGVFVCEGTNRLKNMPVREEEMYFYFTQHFTEGDMLDQADLYNNPWLLQLRGMRDFATFVTKIRAQQIVDLPGFLSGLVGWSKPRPLAWALNKLGKQVYRNVLPSFPSFYTVLDKRDEASKPLFALQQAQEGQYQLSKDETDPLHEVRHKIKARQGN